MIDDFRPARPKKPVKLDNQTPLPQIKNQQPDIEPVFRTPEEIAAVEDSSETVPPRFIKTAAKAQAKLNHHWQNSRKVFLAVMVLVLLAAGSGTFWALKMHRKPAVAAIPKATPIVKPTQPAVTTVPSSLSGLLVEPAVNQRPVTGIMIENSREARPQSGLSQAGVVFEAIAEGGITRFLTLFQDQSPSSVGPVRSVRPYYLQWDLGFDAPLAHVGGSPEALQDIKDWDVKNLDQFANAGAYERVKNRPSPHNVYTSLDKLNQLEAKKGFTSSAFTGFPRKKDASSAQTTARSIDLNVSSALYNVHYDYDSSSNSYKRSEGGNPHIDANSNTQITPKVVIAIIIPYNLESDHKHSQYGIIGNGQAYVFQDGTVTVATWSKLSASGQIMFSDANGQPINLNAGQTWITALSATNKVVYKP